MQRYFLEVAYKGTNYSGSQTQENANTIQAELEKALTIFYRQPFSLTGSSRTDAGVHALQNFYHFDTEDAITNKQLYNLNSILPEDISVNNIYPVPAESHCRFDAVSRKYNYFLYRNKNPFLQDRAWYYPYTIDFPLLNELATILLSHTDFTAFSKRNTQAKTTICTIGESVWEIREDCYVYTVTANRFLRGMVRALVATMLKYARRENGITKFQELLLNKDQSSADFSAPAHGLFLIRVNYPPHLLASLGK